MVFENIEKLKQDYTDKYVVVDATRPELRRFQCLTGVIKTVNMNGRALVEFDGHQNIGWYDIDLDFLKVVDKPQAVEPPKKQAPAKPAAAPAKPKPKPAAPAAQASGGMSVADILAAARGGTAPAGQPTEQPKPAAAPAKPAKAAAPSAAGAKSMSVADILAAARGQAAAAPPAEAEPPAAEEEAVAEPPERPAPAETPTASTPPAAQGDLPTTVPEILAFCRQRDG